MPIVKDLASAYRLAYIHAVENGYADFISYKRGEHSSPHVCIIDIPNGVKVELIDNYQGTIDHEIEFLVEI